MVIADPLVAKGLVDLGFKTKEDLADWLQKDSTISVKNAKTTLLAGRLGEGLPFHGESDSAGVAQFERGTITGP